MIKSQAIPHAQLFSSVNAAVKSWHVREKQPTRLWALAKMYMMYSRTRMSADATSFRRRDVRPKRRATDDATPDVTVVTSYVTCVRRRDGYLTTLATYVRRRDVRRDVMSDVRCVRRRDGCLTTRRTSDDATDV